MRGKNCRKNRRYESKDLGISLSLADADAVTRFVKKSRIAIPRNVGSDLAFLTLPDSVEPIAAVAAIKCI